MTCKCKGCGKDCECHECCGAKMEEKEGKCVCKRCGKEEECECEGCKK